MSQLLRAAYLAVLLPLTAPSAHAQSYFGMAGVQCSQYTKAARSSDMLYHQASQWLLGYVSGMNAAMKVAKGTTPLANLTNDQVLKSAGNYCEANPAQQSRQRGERMVRLVAEADRSAGGRGETAIARQRQPDRSISTARRSSKPLLDRR